MWQHDIDAELRVAARRGALIALTLAVAALAVACAVAVELPPVVVPLDASQSVSGCKS